jgi:three-Cys-motif partner protein
MRDDVSRLSPKAGRVFQLDKWRIKGEYHSEAMVDSDQSRSAGAGDTGSPDTLPHIKRVSRIKHAILHGYLPAWARILGSVNRRVCYFDCYAGPGEYEFGGNRVEGSPLIAVRTASRYVAAKPGRLMSVVLIERDAAEASVLEERLRGGGDPHPEGLNVRILRGDSGNLIGDLLRDVGQLAPSFFMIDPYGHPLAVPLVNQILDRERTEALITLMWYRINMDLGNPSVLHLLDRLFGDSSWRSQQFMRESGRIREDHFLEFFSSRLHGMFVLPFRIGFDPEDGIAGIARNIICFT